MINNHLSHLLAKWYPQRDKCEWVLATIYKTHGPCYRKSGAMMLFSSQGEQLGMLSGGCLESDIGTNARKVMQTGKSAYLCYDGSDEDDLSFHLGIGCGGTVYIMLELVTLKNDYLALTQVYHSLQRRESGCYYQNQNVDGQYDKSKQAYFKHEAISDIAQTASMIKENNWLATPIVPEPHLLIVGGGIDAYPVVNIAQQLGWQVSLWDPRPANARKEYFSHVNHIIKGEADVLAPFVESKQVNAAVLMTHNVILDAQALQALSKTSIQYLALLGPNNRREQVIAHAKIDPQNLPFTFAGPCGLNIGGTLPESIALSVLSECHASLFNKDGKSMSYAL